MAFLLGCSTVLLSSSMLLSIFGVTTVFCLDVKENDAYCNEDGCFVVYFDSKIFLHSWKACKEKGGDLATIKQQKDANAIATLFSTLDLQHLQPKIKVWIGLQRQPRQCSTTHPLRGFSWTTGDEDTAFTYWHTENSLSSCLQPRCVSMSYNSQEQSDNFMWLDGSCFVPADGYLCHYAYKGMCPPLWIEDKINILYFTPFNLQSTILTHIPIGSIAHIPCSSATEDRQVFCMLMEDNSVRWSQEPPFCSEPCEQNNGGCEHFCKESGGYSFCECDFGYMLGLDGKTCDIMNACQESPCEYKCVPTSEGYHCVCPDGYMVATDKHTCLHEEECLLTTCQPLCKNAPRMIDCHCLEGYVLNENGMCKDIDECQGYPCEHSCVNTPGSYSCHCSEHFMLDLDDPSRCQDVDECHDANQCEHKCVNYIGGFECYCKDGYKLMSDNYSCKKVEDEGRSITPALYWLTQQPQVGWDVTEYVYKEQPSTTDWPMKKDNPHEWLTVRPSLTSQQKLGFDSVLDSVTQKSTVLLKATQTILPPTTSSTAVSDWYKHGEKNVATSYSPILSSATPGGATSLWPSYNKKEHYVETVYPPLSVEESENSYVKTTSYQGPVVSIQLTTSQTIFPSLNEGEMIGENLDSGQEVEQMQNNTKLLVGLLVPLCIFVIAMIALCVVYFTHNAANPRTNNSTEGYLWVFGSNDKSGSPNPSAGAKIPV